MLPNFLVIGAMKAGTDSLWEYLRRHPQVYMAETKELDFFVQELNWGQGLGWYERQFSTPASAIAIGEASTSYAKSPVYAGVPARIQTLLPEARLIYVVRHPIERIQSQYLHQCLLGLERRPIDEAVCTENSYVAFSRYGMQLDNYLEYIERSRILVISSEALRHDRTVTIATVLNFLGVDDIWSDPVLGREFHSTSSKRVLRGPFSLAHKIPGHGIVARRVPQRLKDATVRVRTRGVDPQSATLRPDTRRRLEDALREDVVRLRGYLGNGFDGWGLG